MKPLLYVGNKNYSSWSLRPWLVLRWAGLDFETRVVPLGGEGYMERRMPSVLEVSPSGVVPALHVDGEIVTDSLAIAEWAAEQARPRGIDLWPAEPMARALARSATCEMHSAFGSIRSNLPCNIRRRAPARPLDAATSREVARIESVWTHLRERFGQGGPYLFGARPTIADAFFTPVATRFRTYSVALGQVAADYAAALLEEPAFRVWEAEAVTETWSMPIWDAI